MSLSISQKSRLFELIHELLDEHTEANAFYDEYGPIDAEHQEEKRQQKDNNIFNPDQHVHFKSKVSFAGIFKFCFDPAVNIITEIVIPAA